jgi:hypothetical protein
MAAAEDNDHSYGKDEQKLRVFTQMILAIFMFDLCRDIFAKPFN